MALTNAYCTLAQLQARLTIEDTADDNTLEEVITAVSRLIDTYCRRRFYAATETRYYTPARSDSCRVFDLLSVTALATDTAGDRTWSTTWATTDYDLLPLNAALDGEPYTMIETAPNGRYAFPRSPKSLQIAGSFGYAATTPALVREATLLQAARLFKRKDSPFGVMGSPELGMMRISRLDPDVQQLLRSLIRYEYY